MNLRGFLKHLYYSSFINEDDIILDEDTGDELTVKEYILDGKEFCELTEAHLDLILDVNTEYMIVKENNKVVIGYTYK